MSQRFTLPPVLEKIKSLAPADRPIYLVGGAVRDLMMKRPCLDLDLAAPSNGISLARRIAAALDADFVVLDRERDIARVILGRDAGRTLIDISSFHGPALEDDLRSRDFTINAIAYDLRAEALIDPMRGAEDMKAQVIRACLDTSILDDPVRVLRAVRFANALGFQIDPSTMEQMRMHAPRLASVSSERLRDELFKIFDGPAVADAIRQLTELDALRAFVPELAPLHGVSQSAPHVFDVWQHTVATIAAIEKILYSVVAVQPARDGFVHEIATRLGKYRAKFAAHFEVSLNINRSLRALLLFATLYHDVAKPQTKSIDKAGRIHFYRHENLGAEVVTERARAFNLSNDEVERAACLVRNHMRIHSLATQGRPASRTAIYRFFRDAGEAGVDLVLLALADLFGIYDSTLPADLLARYLDLCETLLDNFWDRPAEVVAPPRLLDGTQLMEALSLEPGPRVGQLLESIRENQAAGKIHSREQALAFARRALAKHVDGSR